MIIIITLNFIQIHLHTTRSVVLMENILNNVEKCLLFTGTFGRNGCTANCLGCFVGEAGDKNSMYHGNIDQIHDLLSFLPNLSRVMIDGNPDPSVDPEFCNVAAKLFQKKGIAVSFCTNGVKNEEVIKKLIHGLDVSLIHKICFSIDSLDESKNSFMRGVNISQQSIFNSMKYLKDLGIEVQVYFTIWPANMDEDWGKYRDFFETRGVYINGRFGNVESAHGRINHVPETDILKIREKYKDIRLNLLLANDAEYEEYMTTFVANKEFRCTNLSKINVFLTEDGIKATYYCPIVSTVYPEYFFDIHDLDMPTFYKDLTKTGDCPVARQALGFESEKLHHVCRFYKKIPKKPLPEKTLVSF